MDVRMLISNSSSIRASMIGNSTYKSENTWKDHTSYCCVGINKHEPSLSITELLFPCKELKGHYSPGTDVSGISHTLLLPHTP